MSRRSIGQWWRRLTLPMLALVVVVAACAPASNDGSMDQFSRGLGRVPDGEGFSDVTSAAAAPAFAPAFEEQLQTGRVDELGTGGITSVVLQTPNFGREIVFTADLTVAVNDVTSAGDEATRLIQSLGGFLFGQRTVGSPEPTSVLTFKVQPDRFQEALSRLGSIGEIRSQNVSANDVTEAIVDLESRISTATASVERLRALTSRNTVTAATCVLRMTMT